MLNTALFLAMANKLIIDYLAAPVKQRWPKANFWWLLYLALLTGGLLAWYAGVNLFVEMIPSPLLGRILTSVLVGGGASLIHDVFKGVISSLRGNNRIRFVGGGR